MEASKIVQYPLSKEKILASLYTFFSLKYSALVLLIGAFLIVLLMIFTLILEAMVELFGHIALIYSVCTPIERLLIFVLAWAFFAKSTPALIRLYRAWQGF